MLYEQYAHAELMPIPQKAVVAVILLLNSTASHFRQSLAT